MWPQRSNVLDKLTRVYAAVVLQALERDMLQAIFEPQAIHFGTGSIFCEIQDDPISIIDTQTVIKLEFKT